MAMSKAELFVLLSKVHKGWCVYISEKGKPASTKVAGPYDSEAEAYTALGHLQAALDNERAA